MTGPVPKSPFTVIIYFTGIPFIAQPNHESCIFPGHCFKDGRIGAIWFSRSIIDRFIEISTGSRQETEIRSRLTPLPEVFGSELAAFCRRLSIHPYFILIDRIRLQGADGKADRVEIVS